MIQHINEMNVLLFSEREVVIKLMMSKTPPFSTKVLFLVLLDLSIRQYPSLLFSMFPLPHELTL